MTETFILAHGEVFVQCPYNTAHQITDARITTHLDKCRKAYVKNLTLEGQQKCMKICRYNALHHIPAIELRLHESRCSDSFSIVRYQAHHNSDKGNKQYEQRREQERQSEWQQVQRRSLSSRKKPATTEENWETECTGHKPGYDPSVKLKSQVVIYNPPGLTKSERKRFRNEVRQKAAEMNLKGEPVQFPTAADFEVKQDMIASLKINDEDDACAQETNASAGEHDNENYRRPSTPSSSSTALHTHHHHHQSTAKPGTSKAVDIWKPCAGNTIQKSQDEDADSDDFEGVDPFI